MPGKKKRTSKLVKISVRVWDYQKAQIEREREEDENATQDSIIREALDERYKKGDKTK